MKSSVPKNARGDFVYPRRVLTLRTADSRHMGFRNRDYSYLVGFTSPLHAHAVRNQITHESRMYMANRRPHDVSSEVNEGLAHLADIPEFSGVTIDLQAHLHIEKKETGVRLAGNGILVRDMAAVEAVCKIQLEEFHDFIMYPFLKNIGVVLPLGLIFEDEREFVFESHVIDPNQNTFFFEA